jgi:hypothetical protein
MRERLSKPCFTWADRTAGTIGFLAAIAYVVRHVC